MALDSPRPGPFFAVVSSCAEPVKFYTCRRATAPMRELISGPLSQDNAVHVGRSSVFAKGRRRATHRIEARLA